MKKTYSALALGTAAALSLAACGAAPSDSASDSGASSDYIACMVSDEGGFKDQSFNQSGKEGLDRAESELGIKTITVESKVNADYTTNIDSLLDQNCNMIIGVGFKLADPLTAAAEANPDVDFALIDSTFGSEMDNAKPLIFNTAEAAFLAGYAAAGTTESGSVATYGGVPIPTVQIFMEGFHQGVTRYNEDNGTSVTVQGWDPNHPDSGTFVGDFTNTAKAQQLTESFLSQGADIILPVAGNAGAGTISAVQAAGGNLGIIWVDADGYLSTEGGSYIMTSVVKEIGAAVYDTIEEAVSGDGFSSEPYIGTVANKGVSIAPYHDWESKVPAEVQTKVKELEQQIIDGSLTITTPYDPS
ncbi:BMP family lipoprotein [Actinomyces howellii]|uniref:Purine nucleoside receptor A n=1 Tax=Actinomyces howellii TaxID=52771 RepID=A0A448HFN7_9ACTO|nr:BMP family ABC transporter substrate-binding protein [Actinomyces howellii]VEG27274.1 Purine nucleoside receptor A [Actinomyces howellii]